MTDPKRDYYRELALCALHHASMPCTTDELVELMGVTAQTEQHPRKLWGGINSGSVAGYLRSLENLGQVMRGDTVRKDSRHGRNAAVWQVKGDRNPKYPIPDPPSEVEEAAAASLPPASPYEGHDRKQLLALLDHSDEVMGAVARFFAEVRDINRRHRQRFDDLGMTAPP